VDGVQIISPPYMLDPCAAQIVPQVMCYPQPAISPTKDGSAG